MGVMDNQTHTAPTSARFDFLQTFVQAIHASADPFQIGHAAVHLLNEAFPIRVLTLCQADPSLPNLSVLAQVGKSSQFPTLSPGSALPYESYPLLSRASQQSEPLFLADLHHPASGDLANQIAPFVDQETRGCLCLPLWCGSTFEGVLIVGLATPLRLEGNDLLLFLSCGLHLSTAISHARLQRKLLYGHQYVQGMLDQVPEGVIIADAVSGQIRYVNPQAAQILGMALTDLIDSPLHHSTHTHQQGTEQQTPRSFWTFAVIRALAGETLHQMETVVWRPDGVQVPVYCSAAPLQGERGAITGAILVLQDMTLQKHLERHKNAFLALASHELRTPLTAVLGYAEIIEKTTARPETHRLDPAVLQTSAHHIMHEAEHMAFLIDEMLDLSSLDHDQLILHLAQYDLREILERIVETQRQTSQKHQLRLVLDERTRANGCTTSTDRARLVQAFSNLVANAIKYSPLGGEIEVGLRQEGQPPNRVCIWVTDHGLGIAPEDLPHLFQRFYRSRKLDRAISGLGVGLYLAKQIIERHSGHIWVESTEGHGATFSVILPLT